MQGLHKCTHPGTGSVRCTFGCVDGSFCRLLCALGKPGFGLAVPGSRLHRLTGFPGLLSRFGAGRTLFHFPARFDGLGSANGAGFSLLGPCPCRAVLVRHTASLAGLWGPGGFNQDIQNGDREQALALLEKFSPLLKKYAFFLQSEDALQDFQCFLLAFAKNLQLNELTISTDGAIISYINKAIYHHYIALSKAKRHQLPTVSIESQTDYDPLQFDTAFSESDTYNNLLLLDLKRALSTEEYHVIYDHYFRQYSIQEIATRDNKSRQAINKCKKTAIIKLRRYFGVTS